MTANKKTLRKKKDSKRRAGNKATRIKPAGGEKTPAAKRKPVKKKAAGKVATRKLVKSKEATKKVAAKTKPSLKKKLGPSRPRAVRTRVPEVSQMPDMTVLSPPRIVGHSGGQSGDLQGLSGVESVNSESVDELLEEGNAFEAGVVMGVEDAGNSDPVEVRTHQVPEDDVPDEYLDCD
jgi:hypothetical protein